MDLDFAVMSCVNVLFLIKFWAFCIKALKVLLTVDPVLESLCSAFYGGCKRNTARLCCWPPFCCSPCCCGAVAAVRRPAAIDRCFLPTGTTAANPPQRHAAVNRWNRETNRRTDRRTDNVPLHRPCSAYYAGNTNRASWQRSMNTWTTWFIVNIFTLTLDGKCCIGCLLGSTLHGRIVIFI